MDRNTIKENIDKMPVVKTSKEGNVTTEIIDMTEGKGHLSTDEILAKTGTQGGTYTEVGPDGKTYTYSVEVEEVRIFDHFTLSSALFCRLVQCTNSSYIVN